ncbi:MAG: TlpA disulfide reductase family protein [Longimicrobiales bacterium]
MKRTLVLALFLVIGCKQPAFFARVGEMAPDFGAPTLTGDSLALSGLRGNVVLLNVWATWCIPCRKEIPELQALHQEYSARGLQVIGVSVDDGNADGDVRAFVRNYGVTYTILRDPAENVTAMFFIPGVPATFLIDRTGKVAWRHLGPFTTKDPDLQSVLKQTL